MRLGKNEREVLYDISITPGDVLVGFLCSAGSTARAKQIAHSKAVSRRNREGHGRFEYQKRKRVIQQLVKKNMITLTETDEGDQKVILRKAGEAIAGETRLLRAVRKNHDKDAWDGQWTLVTFDIPSQESAKRYKLVSLLYKMGFAQVQLSNYVFPHWIPELEVFLKKNNSVGQYCHLFRGNYFGDKEKLKKKFKL